MEINEVDNTDFVITGVVKHGRVEVRATIQNDLAFAVMSKATAKCIKGLGCSDEEAEAKVDYICEHLIDIPIRDKKYEYMVATVSKLNDKFGLLIEAETREEGLDMLIGMIQATAQIVKDFDSDSLDEVKESLKKAMMEEIGIETKNDEGITW